MQGNATATTWIAAEAGKLPVPVAYDETLDSDIFWDADPCDDMLPASPGFISDIVYHTRGREVASIFMIWSAISCICNAVKRDAWLRWGDSKLYANIYAMICAPPGAVKKNTSIDIAIKLLDYLDLAIEEIGADSNIVRMKRINPFHSKASPEALVSMMVPENKRGEDFELEDAKGNPMLGPDGKTIKYYRGSELAIYQHEMAALLGKQSYMEGLMEMLLNFYDCHDRWSVVTQSRGNEELHNIFVSFFAALTPTTLKLSLPDAATGDGFMSRCMVVYQPFTEREFYMPEVPTDAPDKNELRRRLAWIASTTFGEWQFTDEAKAWIKEWYHGFKQQLSVDGLFMGLKSRWDVILYKLAMVVRWQRYDRNDKLIHLQDVIDAEHILRRTFQESTPIYRMIMNSGMTDRGLKAEEYLSKVGQVTRRDLIRRVHISAEDLNPALEVMIEEGRVEVWMNDNKLETFRGVNNELYRWVGDVAKVKRRTSPTYQPKKQDALEAWNGYNETIANAAVQPGQPLNIWEAIQSQSHQQRQANRAVPAVQVDKKIGPANGRKQRND